MGPDSERIAVGGLPGLLATVGVGEASYRLIEQPVINLWRRRRDAQREKAAVELIAA